MGWGSTLMQNETSFLILDGAYVPLIISIVRENPVLTLTG